MVRAENDFVRNRVAKRVGRVQKCFTSKLCLFNVSFFPLFKNRSFKNVNGIKKVF